MKVVVREPFRVCHEGKVWRPGDTAEVPEHVGAHWGRSGWVEQVGASSSSSSKRTKAAEHAEPAPGDK